MTATPRRAPIFGPEPWATVAGAQWCHFDRWFTLAAAADFAGDLDGLEAELVGRLHSSLHGRGGVEAKLSHLADLRHRLAAAGIDAAALATHEEADKATSAKARRKVFDQALEGRAMTEPMRKTPLVRLDRRARYGRWDDFPVNPGRWYERLAGRKPAVHVSKGRTFAVARQLGERLARYDGPRRGLADRLALYRAFHTVGVELAERGDDSYGNIGSFASTRFAPTSPSTGLLPAWRPSTTGRICASCSCRTCMRSPSGTRRSRSIACLAGRPT